MQTTDISSSLQAFLLESFPRHDRELSPSVNLLDDWFLDSLGIVQTVIFLESEFSIDVKPLDITAENFRSIDTLTQYVERQLATD